MQPCELFVIPCSLLLPLLSVAQIKALKGQVSDQQLKRQGRAAGGAGGGDEGGGKAAQWPKAAGVLREYLKALPGSRPAWQVRTPWMELEAWASLVQSHS